ncbi:hypothetical protein ACNRBV_21180 [Ralstonia pseudosolanacearum]|uniref:Uncharacterized protein n=1 Tax=Ralstonia phage RSA1 TaxID=2993856 RepID=A4PE59_9CAUD|nr:MULTISPECIES: hypothetical protein [Ralstonia]YP_001165286.1 hypothetical protein RPRSA1_gp37 [Ralstonia phage RSA1]ANH31594.1 hypothetical protein A3768_0413 [Ralstonia solanacearum]ARS57402.1 hypothetical protein BC427_15540 [Ralstonia solanacearum FJAT-91]ASL73681.1 hypothetical protein BC350_08600 [Ralstonia pseudosolanacearum]AUS41142.1 hypothetical protein CYD94_02090 [Ralstonia solanacearum]NKF76670.1 hypothetical protein [Ralstonia solanacearum]
MSEIELCITEEELQVLEQVRQQQGLATISQAAEWLVKTSLRNTAERMTGKRRSLRLVVPLEIKQ